MKEAELAELIINHFENKGYESYKEVVSPKNSRRTDCYFVKRENGEIVETIVLETKMTFSLKVLEQCFKWKSMANFCYIGIPKSKRKDFKLRRFGYDICKKYLKIGVIEVDINGYVHEIFGSERNDKPQLPKLYEEQKDSIAGNDNGEYFTAFKNTLNLIHKYMEDKDKVLYNTLIKEIEHHYASDNSAKQSLKEYVGEKQKGKNKLLSEYELVYESKKWWIYKKL